jgi:phage terminase small subunit
MMDVGVLKNPKHELFAQEVAKRTALERAYEMAGYSPDPKNAARLTKKDAVRTRIDEIMTEAAVKSGVTVERIIAELAKIGFSDIRKAVRWKSALITEEEQPDGGDVLVVKNVVTNQVEIVSSDEIDDDTAAAIAEVSQNTTGGVKIKFHDKRAALVDIGKHLGMFRDTANVNVALQATVRFVIEAAPPILDLDAIEVVSDGKAG